MRISRRPAPLTWLLLVGIAIVCASGLVQLSKGHNNPPLFDGVGFPDEPYRYVNPPASALKTKAPEGATSTTSLLGDKTNGAISVATVEKGPQVTAEFRIGMLQAGPTAKTITVALEPKAVETPPSNGTMEGNAYSVTVSADDKKPVTIAANARYYVSMRIPIATREAIAIEVFADGEWQTMRTTQTGTDVYSAYVPVLGDVVPVLVTSGDTSLAAAAGSGGSGGMIIALVVAICVVAGVVVFTVRTRALRDAALANPPGDQVSGDVSGGGSSS